MNIIEQYFQNDREKNTLMEISNTINEFYSQVVLFIFREQQLAHRCLREMLEC